MSEINISCNSKQSAVLPWKWDLPHCQVDLTFSNSDGNSDYRYVWFVLFHIPMNTTGTFIAPAPHPRYKQLSVPFHI